MKGLVFQPHREPAPRAEQSGASAIGSFVARQPIYDRELRVVAYELLFRDGDHGDARFADPEVATARTIVNTFSEIGLNSIVGSLPALINVSGGFLRGGFPGLLPADRVGLELLEDVTIDEELLAILRDLKVRGFQIVCDDFVYRESAGPLLKLADIVKLDLLALDPQRLEHDVRLLRRFDVELVAEKVETYEVFDRCHALGFDYFQGYFFCRPRTFRGGALPASLLTSLCIAARLQDPDLEFEELAELVSRDPGLSYRLLRYLNSAGIWLERRFASIREALVMVGFTTIRDWATLLLLADVGMKPSELVVTAMVRARMCSLLALESGVADEDAAFTTGLLSVVDALADAPLEAVVSELPLAAPIAAALIASEGPLGRILTCVVDYERGPVEPGRYPELEAVCLERAYLDAVAWAESTRSVVMQ
jgi:EAL and modified HD-GYP domain-containing signal transduction protein